MAGTQSIATGSLAERLRARGFTRRDFLKYCGSLAVMLGLSETMAPQVAEAIEIGEASGKLLPVIWMEGGSCSGCTEALAQTDTPDIPQLVLETISLNYSEVLSAAAGHSVEQARKDTIKAGGYVLIYEGAVPTAYDGNVMIVGGEKGTDSLAEAAENADAVIALGSCACDGGWMAARPNDSEAMGVQKFLSERGIDTPVVNIPCCPANPEWLIAVIVEYALMGTLPELNDKNVPASIGDQTVHDNCPRRGHFWNRSISWCVEAGGPCIGCGNVEPMHPQRNWVDEDTPFLKRHRDLSLLGFEFQPTTAALAVTGVVVAALVVHGVGMKVAGRVDGGADFEPERRWDVRHGTEEAHKAGARAAKLYDELDERGLEPKNIDRFKKIRAAKKEARSHENEAKPVDPADALRDAGAPEAAGKPADTTEKGGDE